MNMSEGMNVNENGNERCSGILLHFTSLPSVYGIGDLGPNAYRFADFLTNSRQYIWQVLPITTIALELGASPYNSSSAFAGNKYLISPELLLRTGWLNEDDLPTIPTFNKQYVDYKKVITFKDKLFEVVYSNFEVQRSRIYNEYGNFCNDNKAWLDDFATFIAFKNYFAGKTFIDWPVEFRDRIQKHIEQLKDELKNEIEKERFLQFLFFQQWMDLKKYCNNQGLRIFGDMPIYVDLDSADVWTHPELFKLDDNKRPVFVAGVPPDYFSETGQRWGNPVYNWARIREGGYSWWIHRFKHNLRLFDLIRIDHFRGFAGYWEIKASEKNAVNGAWIEGPGEELFYTVKNKIQPLPIIAEDLGVITEDVEDLLRKFEIPGLKVLLFAFGDDFDKGPYIPENFKKNCVVYTGTHDNNTVFGWFVNDATEIEKKNLNRYFNEEITKENVCWKLIELAMTSVANTAIIPMQDLLCLGAEARMNVPSKIKGNWRWRVTEEQLSEELANRLRVQTEKCGRSN